MVLLTFYNKHGLAYQDNLLPHVCDWVRALGNAREKESVKGEKLEKHTEKAFVGRKRLVICILGKLIWPSFFHKTISKLKREGYKHVNKTQKPDFYKFMSTKSSKTKKA